MNEEARPLPAEDYERLKSGLTKFPLSELNK